MICKICGQPSKKIFTKKVLHKYDVDYFRCDNCLFIQTEDPYWLNEAYGSAINFSDIGLLSRNSIFIEKVTAFFRLVKFDPAKKYLDYGGGYGIFVRMMRDNGYNFFWSDEYCENIFAKKFSAQESETGQKYEVVTAFEVFEHLVNPKQEIEKMLTFSDSILFSTQLAKDPISEIENWWYIAPEHGQHVSIYNKRTLEFIAKHYGLLLYSYKELHLLTKKKINKRLFKIGNNYQFARIYNTLFRPASLLEADYKMYMKEQ